MYLIVVQHLKFYFKGISYFFFLFLRKCENIQLIMSHSRDHNLCLLAHHKTSNLLSHQMPFSPQHGISYPQKRTTSSLGKFSQLLTAPSGHCSGYLMVLKLRQSFGQFPIELKIKGRILPLLTTTTYSSSTALNVFRDAFLTFQLSFPTVL